MLLSKDIVWQNGYKKNTLIYATYKRLTSDLNTHTDRNSENGKRYSMQMKMKRTPGYQYLYQTK